MRKLRIAVLMHPTLVPPESKDGYSEDEVYQWKTEYDVIHTLRGLGHEVRPLGVQDELVPIRALVDEWEPHLFFNLLEEFHGLGHFDQHVVSYLELLQVPYTGCNPRGLMLARGKALAKKLLAYHRIRTPHFAIFPRGRAVKPSRSLKYPLFVKSASEEASLGISQASIVTNPEKLADRVAFVHENIGSDAIVEEYVEGRELYVGMIGNRRVQVLPVWELRFERLPAGSAAIATARVKHNPRYQEERGIFQQRAENLPEKLSAHIIRTCRRIYRVLEIDGYARIDYRLSESGELFFLEANPNPEIAESEEFASAALDVGLTYPLLLQKIVNLGLARAR